MKRAILWILYTIIGRGVLSLLFGIRFLGRKHLKMHEQYIIVANHNSHFDTISILSAMPSNKLITIQPIAAADYFAATKWKAFLTRYFVNALLIPRKRPKSPEDGPDPIELIINALDQGKSLIVYPEGTRGNPDQMERFKRGIGLVLEARPDIPVVPAYFKGIGRVLPKGERLPVPFNTVLEFGEPQFIRARSCDEIAAEVEQRVVFLRMKSQQYH